MLFLVFSAFRLVLGQSPAPADPLPAAASSPAPVVPDPGTASAPTPSSEQDTTVSPAPESTATVNPLQPETTLIPDQNTTGSDGDLPVRDAQAVLDSQGHPVNANHPPVPEPDAQSLLASDPLARTALQMAQTNAETLYDGVGGVPRPLSSLYLNQNFTGGGSGFQRGDFALAPTVSVGFNYRRTTGSHLGGNGTEAYALLSPAFDLSIGEPATGRVLSVGYIGSLALGDQGGRDSPYDQTLAARGVLEFTKLTLGFGLQYSGLSGPTRDTGGADINQQLLGVSLTAGYQYSEKTSVESDVTSPIRLFADAATSSEGVSDTTFLNYAYSALTTVGVGVAGGYLAVEDSRSQTFEQILSRVTYLGTTLVYNGTLGVEFRDTGYNEEITPILGLGITYEPREGTRLTLSADRRVLNSALDAGYNYITSSVALTATQRLGSSWQATGSVGFENAAYDEVDGQEGPNINRDDNYVVVQGGVTVAVNRRWDASAIITYGNDQSRVDGNKFFQGLVQLSYSY